MAKYIATHKVSGQTLEAEGAFRSAAISTDWVFSIGKENRALRLHVADWDVKEVKPSIHEQIRNLKLGSAFHLEDPETGETFKASIRLYGDEIYGVVNGKRDIADFHPAKDRLVLVVDHIPNAH